MPAGLALAAPGPLRASPRREAVVSFLAIVWLVSLVLAFGAGMVVRSEQVCRQNPWLQGYSEGWEARKAYEDARANALFVGRLRDRHRGTRPPRRFKLDDDPRDHGGDS
jgi:hypothetical protein